MLLILALACTVLPYGGGGGVASPVTPVEAAPSTPIEPLLARVDALLAGATELDARDRLVELRELITAVSTAEPAVRSRVLRYAERVLYVEERAQPQPVAEMAMEMAEGFEAVTEVEIVDGPSPVESARALLEAGKLLEAVVAAESLPPSAEGSALLTEAGNAWVRGERERYGAAFLAAKAMAAGPERTAAITAARDGLAALNTRFPQNAYAEDIRRNIETVEAELKR